MLILWLIYAAVCNFSPVHLYADDRVPRNKRSDDFIPCEKGWYLFREKCFKVFGRKRTDKLNWEKASARCSYEGGHLATIQSKEETDFIVSFLLLDVQKDVWIGLHDRVNESVYTWQDESPVNYTNWKENEPQPSTTDHEDCVEMWFRPDRNIVGQWNDLSCDREYPYICETKIDKSKKSPNPQYCASAPGGWKYHSSCYHVITEVKTWQNAEQHCIDNFKGHLITILDTTVDLFLDNILSNINKGFWIGIKIKSQRQQKWISGWHVSYNGLVNEDGDFIDGTCVVRNRRKEWSIVPCSKKLSFICETTSVVPPVLKPPVKGAHCPEVPDDWVDLDGESCYFIETEKTVSWYEANFDCKRRGANLLSIHSKEESEILNPFVKYTQGNTYIGLLRLLMHDDAFAWSDDSVMDFENWSFGEPNTEEERCGEVWIEHMEWNDVHCESRRGYICYVKKIIPNITIVETSECAGYVPITALIGVAVCIILVIILLGVVVYCFRSWDVERRKASTGVPVPQGALANIRTRYRSQTELTVKDEDNYESMY